MDGDGSLRLAKALRNATQHTDTPFGNDVRTAYQLLARILQHESSQQGFELAATRDADFHEVGSPLGEPGTSGDGLGAQVSCRGQLESSPACERSSNPASSRQNFTFQM